jgi:transposase-like protein
MTANLENPIFQDADLAREFLEGVRWPNGPVCPHCGVVEGAHKLEGKASRPGLYQCNACHGQFTVTVGTVFERSKIALNKWLLATCLMSSSKKGMSAHQLHRMMGVTYKTAWFMCHRIREAMRNGSLAPMGGTGKTVEIDETYIGVKKGKRIRRGHMHKHAVLALVERGGEVRSFKLNGLKVRDIEPIVRRNVSKETSMVTDESQVYPDVTFGYVNHSTVNHSAKEYVRGDVYTNTVEGYFSIFKRGMKGVYQHCGEKHLHRYLAEFDFRYNNRTSLKVTDIQRTSKALAGIEGKRLTYRRSRLRTN